MTSNSDVKVLLSQMPRGVSFAARLNWLEDLETKFRGDVKSHSDGVCRYSVHLARAIGFDDAFVSDLNAAARWHDIGKLATPDGILHKPSRLTETEMQVMQEHAKDGVLLLGPEAPQVWLDVVQYHHERYDGHGYHGLKGENIPVAARLTAVADTFDALTQKRVYKDGMTVEDALRLMSANVESPGFGRRAFDPIFLRVFVATYLNDPTVTFSDDGRKSLENYAISNPMNDIDGDKYTNDGWLLKLNGKRLNYAKAENGNDRLLEIRSPTGDLIFDTIPLKNTDCLKIT